VHNRQTAQSDFECCLKVVIKDRLGLSFVGGLW